MFYRRSNAESGEKKLRGHRKTLELYLFGIRCIYMKTPLTSQTEYKIVNQERFRTNLLLVQCISVIKNKSKLE